MERIQYSILIVMIVAGLSGCQPYAQKKQEMVQQWEASTASARIPVAEDQLKRGEIAEARETLTRCLQANPELTKAHFLMGRICLAEGQMEESRQYFSRAVELDPRMDEAWYALGILEQEQGQLVQAGDYVQKALEIRPIQVQYILSRVHLYRLLGQTDQAQQFLEQKRQLLPNEPELFIEAAQLAQFNGNETEAIQLYKRAILQNGENPQLLEALGVCYMNQQQWAPAAGVFEKLLDKVPAEGKETILQWLAQCCSNAEQYGKSLDWYDKLSVYRRQDPQLWLDMAQAALGANQPDRAVACAEKALGLHTGWTQAKAVLGSAVYMQKQYPRALRIFSQIKNDDVWGAYAWYMTGRCYQKTGQTILAQKAFEKSSALRPDGRLTQMFTENENL